MNERIRELWLQSAREDSGDKWDSQEEFIERFAELIVRECLNQCERIRSDAATQKKSDFLTESGKTLYEGVYGGATNCGFAIQQHFGVKE